MQKVVHEEAALKECILSRGLNFFPLPVSGYHDVSS